MWTLYDLPAKQQTRDQWDSIKSIILGRGRERNMTKDVELSCSIENVKTLDTKNSSLV